MLVKNRRTPKARMSIKRKLNEVGMRVENYFIIVTAIISIVILQMSTGFLTEAYLRYKDLALGTGSKVSNRFDHTVVPPIVHFVWTNQIKYPFSFHHALSIISAAEQIEPEVINLWFIRQPRGIWWDMVLKRVPKSKLRLRLLDPQQKNRVQMTDHGDVIRLENLLEFGGILLDFNVIILRPLDQLMKYKAVVGSLEQNSPSDHLVLAERGATFIRKWRRAYDNERKPADVGKLRQRILRSTQDKWPKLVHTDAVNILRPYGSEAHLLKTRWEWRSYYALNLWPQETGITKDFQPDDIDCLDTSLGEVLRRVLYRSEKLRCKNHQR